MKEEKHNLLSQHLFESFDASAKPVIALDVDKYQAWLDGSGLSAAEKEEFLQAMWSIIVSFMELGFGVHPLQEVCGKDFERAAQEPNPASGHVESDDPCNNSGSPPDGPEVE